MTFFKVLNIEPTKNEVVIREAYRKQLVVTHPEESPEAFKALRKAYEEALDYAKRTEYGEEIVQNPVDVWLNKVQMCYHVFKERIKVERWRALLREDICSDFDTEEEAQYALLRFLMDYPFLPSEIWSEIEKCFKIESQKKALSKIFPQNFITFVIEAKVAGHALGVANYAWFEGEDHADYDAYMKQITACYDAIGSGNQEAMQQEIMEFERFHKSLWHPEQALIELRYALINHRKDAAKQACNRLEKYQMDGVFKAWCARYHWVYGSKEQAKAMWLENMNQQKENPSFNVGITRIGIARIALEEGDYETAVAVYRELGDNTIPNELGSEVFRDFDEARDKLISVYKQAVEAHPDDLAKKWQLMPLLLEKKRYEEAQGCLDTIDTSQLEKEDSNQYYKFSVHIRIQLGDNKAAQKSIFEWEEKEGVSNYERARSMIVCLDNSQDYEGMATYLQREIIIFKLIDDTGLEASKTRYLEAWQAYAYMRAGDYKACIELCKRLIEAEEDTENIAKLYLFLAESYKKEGQRKAFTEVFYKLLELGIHTIEAYESMLQLVEHYKGVEDLWDLMFKVVADRRIQSPRIQLSKYMRRYQIAEAKRDIEEFKAILVELESFEASVRRLPYEMKESYKIALYRVKYQHYIGALETAWELMCETLEGVGEKDVLFEKASILYEQQKYEDALSIYECIQTDYKEEHKKKKLGIDSCRLKIRNHQKMNKVVNQVKVSLYDEDQINACMERLKAKMEAYNNPSQNKQAVYEAILRETQELAQLGSSLESYQLLASAYVLEGEWDKAISTYKKVRELAPNLSMAYVELGKIYRRKRNYAAAVDCFKCIVERTHVSDIEGREAAKRELIKVYREMGAYDKVKAVCWDNLLQESQQQHLLESTLKKQWSKLIKWIDTYGKARSIYLRIACIKQTPQMDINDKNLALIALDRGQWKEATKRMKRVIIRSEEEIEEAVSIIVGCYVKRRQIKQAERYLQTMMLAYPESAVLCKLYSVFLENLKQHSEEAHVWAQKAYTLAVTKGKVREQEPYYLLMVQSSHNIGNMKGTQKYYNEWLNYIIKKYNTVENYCADKRNQRYAYYTMILMAYARERDIEVQEYLDKMRQLPRCRGCHKPKCMEMVEAAGLYAALKGDKVYALQCYEEVVENAPQKLTLAKRISILKRELKKH